MTNTFAAEYRSTSKVAMHITWLRQFLSEIQPQSKQQAITLQVDNKSAIACTKKQASTKKSKNIDVRFHHIQDLVANNIITTTHESKAELLADMLTKPLGLQKFIKHRQNLGVLPPPAIPMAVEVS